MKILITDYTFDASEKKITFNDYSAISLEKILLVTNATDNIIIFNFSDSAKGGTVATNVLTLAYDTTTMADGDKLQIWYDDTDQDLNIKPSLFQTIMNTSGGTVAADFSLVALGTATQSANYDFWITDILFGSITDATTELVTNRIQVNCQYFIGGNLALIWDGEIPNNTHIHLETPIKIPKNTAHQLRVRLGGATALNIYSSVRGYQTP